MDRKNKLLIGSSAAVIIAVIIMICISLAMCNAPKSNTVGGMTFDGNAVDYTPSYTVSESQNDIAIPVFSEIFFPADETEVPMVLHNPKQNTCLFKYELYIKGESEPIAATGLIAPGKAVEKIKLKHKLKAGEYSLEIHVSTYTEENGTSLNGAVVDAKLRVLK